MVHRIVKKRAAFGIQGLPIAQELGGAGGSRSLSNFCCPRSIGVRTTFSGWELGVTLRAVGAGEASPQPHQGWWGDPPCGRSWIFTRRRSWALAVRKPQHGQRTTVRRSSTASPNCSMASRTSFQHPKAGADATGWSTVRHETPPFDSVVLAAPSLEGSPFTSGHFQPGIRPASIPRCL